MKQFIDKLIERLEEEKVDIGAKTGFFKGVDKAIEIVNQIAEEYNNSNDSMEIQIAKNYAKWLTKCGVNITEKWETATTQAYALNEAYMRGMQDERDRFARWQDEHKDGWIPCSERLPEEYGEYFIWWTDITEKEYCEISEFHPEEGWIGNIPQAFSGKYTVIAWRELPGPFKRKGE